MFFISAKDQYSEKLKIDDDIIKAEKLKFWSVYRTVGFLNTLLFILGSVFSFFFIKNVNKLIEIKDLPKKILQLRLIRKITCYYVCTFFVSYIIFNLSFSTKDIGLPITICTLKRCISLMTFGKFYKDFYIKDAFYGIKDKSEKILFTILSLVFYKIFLILASFLILKFIQSSDDKFLFIIFFLFYLVLMSFIYHAFSFSFACVRKNGNKIKVFFNFLSFSNIFKEEVDEEKIKIYNTSLVESP